MGKPSRRAISVSAFAEVDAHLAAIVDSSFDAIVGKDLNSVIRTWNGAAERMFGYTAAEAIGQSVLMLIPDERKGEEASIIERIAQGIRVETFETVRLRKDGTRIPVSLTISPIKTADGAIIGASKIARDISVRKENERRIRLLLREVNHRVKNQFAVILSMIRETAKRTKDPLEFEARIRDRIMALSRSHDLLVNADWVGADLFALLKEHLAIFGHEDQVVLSGPLITLKPQAVQYLGIAFHELATNSAKYGALSGRDGRVRIDWSADHNPTGDVEFAIVWDETFTKKDPQNVRDNNAGFGTVVLSRIAPSALSGTASLARQSGRIIWALKAPADHVVSSPADDETDEEPSPPVEALY